MTTAGRLATAEAAYLEARDARDRLDVARATGEPADPGEVAALEARAAAASGAVHVALDAFGEADVAGLDDEDRRALEAMRRGLGAADEYQLPFGPEADPDDCADEAVGREAIRAGGETLHRRLEACYAAAADALVFSGEPLTRVQVLDRLGTEPDPATRRALFMTLRPLWDAVNGDDGDGSPYRRYIADAAPGWHAAHGPGEESAVLGVPAEEIEAWSTAILAAWRAAVVEPARERGDPPAEPWDWWWLAGAAQRAIGPIALDDVVAVNRDVYASLGADPGALRVRFDIRRRTGRPPLPVAFTTFGGRPHRLEDGSWSPGEPVILENLTDGGFTELAELLHETGHAIHIAGIRTRPAFADWPDSDAFTEALADVVAYDAADPAWLRRWLPGRTVVPEALSLRCWYAGVVLDAAWALFEIRMLADPGQRPNEVWTGLTSTWLGLAPHPEWSWWAIRGQLVQEAGYMTNYAVGSVLAAALRRAIRTARGDWLAGDPGWYAWVRDAIYRYGQERPARDVLEEVLGGQPTADALLEDIGRAAGAPLG